MTRYERWTGILLLVLALALRIPTLVWGLPEGGRTWTYHPDEPMVLWLTDCVRSEGWICVPRYFISQPAGYGLFVMGLESIFFSERPHAEWSDSELRREVLLLRGLHLLASLGALLLLERIGRTLGSPRAGRIALAFGAVSPFLVYFSTFHTVNEASLLPILGALWAWIRYDLDPSPRRALLAAGLSALSTGVKYTAAPLLVFGFVLPLLHRRPRDLFALAASFVVLVALLPFAWIEPGATWNAFLGFFGPRGTYFTDIHVSPWAPFLRVMAFAFPNFLSVAAGIFLLRGLGSGTRPGVRILSSWILLYGAILLFFGVRFGRHFIPWIPPALLLAGLGAAAWFPSGKGKILFPLLFLLSLGNAARVGQRFLRPETRDLAARETLARTNPGDRIGMAWYFWTPYLRNVPRRVETEVYPWSVAHDTAPRYAALLWGGRELEWLPPGGLPAYPREIRVAHSARSPGEIEDLEYVSPEIRIFLPR